MNFLATLLQSQPDLPPAAQQALALMAPVFMILGLVILAILMIPFWFICKKAGLSPWLTLLNLVPFGGLILLYVLAFAEWKVAPVPQMAYPPPYPQPPMPPQA
ncbi:MAG: hypothetical protein ABSC62_06805 [Terracidiphilus sp.]|jgi:hypothetical protein